MEGDIGTVASGGVSTIGCQSVERLVGLVVLKINDQIRPEPTTRHLTRIATLIRNDSAPILGHKIVIGMGMAVTPQINSVLLHQPA